jgi:2-dehydro-3-deoxyphosphogluconate aldolase/(4S)-4-hydroxy-2-oxoglutarate aldolase
LNPAVVKEARKIDFPFIPGIITPSEVEQALELGCTVLKLFPAESSGGVSRLKALAGPYRHAGISFIPMGGINMDNLGQYLARPEVTAAGGSWLASKEFIQKQEFEKITENAKKSLKISQKFL